VRPFAYETPRTVQEAIALLQPDEPESTRPLAGGTDLLTLMKADIAAPARLVNLKRLQGLPAGIEESSGGGLTLGALVTLAELEGHALVAQRYTALAEAVALAATPQLRNMATLGGNLLQRPRCWYFRQARFPCWLKGGETCHARDGENELHALFGGGPCHAVHPSDLAAALLALDAEVRLIGTKGTRTLQLGDFFALPEAGRRCETVIGTDELLLSVLLPAPAAGACSTYLKAMDRKSWAFALVGVAAALRVEHGRITGARLVLSGVAPIPWRVAAAEQALQGEKLNDALIARAASVAFEDAKPLEQNGYKRRLGEALVRRALQRLASSELLR
jgi:xanthine dehydrogenase YagS FAD-binding subunit